MKQTGPRLGLDFIPHPSHMRGAEGPEDVEPGDRTRPDDRSARLPIATEYSGEAPANGFEGGETANRAGYQSQIAFSALTADTIRRWAAWAWAAG